MSKVYSLPYDRNIHSMLKLGMGKEVCLTNVNRKPGNHSEGKLIGLMQRGEKIIIVVDKLSKQSYNAYA